MANLTSHRRLLLFTVFFVNLLSLSCQVLWSRKLSFLFGSTAAVFSTVLTVYLLGLAVGALLGGRAIDRAAAPWRLLARLVLVLGVYCLGSLFLFDGGRNLFLRVFPADASPFAAAAAKFVVVLVLLLLPTMCIGAVFPAVVRLFGNRTGSLGSDVSLVYALDTLGAALGALLAGFVLVPAVGLRASTWLLGAGALLLGAVLLRVKGEAPAAAAGTDGPAPDGVTATAAAPVPSQAGRRKERKGAKDRDRDRAGRDRRPEAAAAPEVVWRPWTEPLVLGTFFLSGAAALLLETGWNRFFYVLNGTSVYSLAVVLAGFLSGIGFGSLLMKRRIDRLRDPWSAVAYLYAAIALGGVLVFRFADVFGRFYLAIYQGTGSYYAFQIQVYLLIFVLVALPALAMGANFPLVAKLCARAAERRGSSVGKVFFWNTLGAVLGAFLGEFVLLPAGGFSALMLVTLAIYVLGTAVFLALSPNPARLRHAAACGVLVLLAIVLSPAVRRFDMPFHAVYYHGLRAKTWQAYRAQLEQMRVLWEKHGFYGHVAIAEIGDYVLLKHNGKTDASTSPEDNRTQILMGHMPLLFHPDPKEVLNIGLGGGATLRAIAHHPNLAHITQVEIDPLVTEAARLYFGEFNDRALDDPRLRLVTNDGRNYMDASERTYDVISSVPPNIWVSGVSGLFTREFYVSAKRHLKPGGILCQWTPLHEFERDDLRIALRTITGVFPHAAAWVSGSDVIIIASDRPLQVDPARVAARLQVPAVARDFAEIGIPLQEVQPLLGKPDFRPEGLVDAPEGGGKDGPVNVDDRPLLEFRTARNLFSFNKR
jgi:spermidine synthase